MRRVVSILCLSFLVLDGAGCGASRPARYAHAAEQLRIRVPGLMHSDQRRGILYAAAAAAAAPTVDGTELLRAADDEFPGVTRVLAFSKPQLTTALRTSPGTLITASSTGEVDVWNTSSATPTFATRLRTPVVRFAGSYSPLLIASADAHGQLTLWDLEDPSHLSQIAIRDGTVHGSIVGLGFADRSTELLAVTSTGELYRFDVLDHRRIAARPLRPPDDATSGRPGGLHLTAASIVSEEYASSTTLLLASSTDGILELSVPAFSWKRLLPAAEIAGTVTSLIGEPDHPGGVILGTSAGTLVWDGKGQTPVTERTGPSSGVATLGSSVLAGNRSGLSVTNPTALEANGGSFPAYQGRPAQAVFGGPGGAVEIDLDGTVSLLGETQPSTVIPTSSAESSIIATFGPEGDLLEASGPNANDVESLVAVRPGVTAPYSEGNAVAHRYTPSPSWWPTSGYEPHGLFIDDAELTSSYVLAAGQDPTGVAVVLVWDAKTGRPLHRLPLLASQVNGQEIQTKTPSLVSGVTLLPKAHLIAAYSTLQELIVLWSTRTWKRVATILVGPIDSFDVNRGETSLLVDSLSDSQSGLDYGNSKTRLVFINLASGKTERSVISEGTLIAGYLANGDILTAQKDGQIRQLDPSARHEVTAPIDTEGGEINAWALDEHDDLLAFASSNATVRTVDLRTRAITAPFPSEAGTQPIAVSFSPSGALLAASEGRVLGANGQAAPPRIWRRATTPLMQRACQLVGPPLRASEWSSWETSLPLPGVCDTHRSHRRGG
jgi:WD40 repeat protein